MASFDPNLSDLALLRRSAGSDDALELLISRYTRLVRACARPFFLVGGDHEDLLQEGMIGLLTAIRQYDPDSETPFSSFAAVCIRNRLISVVRMAAAQKHTPLNDSVSLHACSFEWMTNDAPEADPEAFCIGKESFAEFQNALESLLSPFEKQVLGLYLKGYSYQEIADSFHKSAKSADNAVQRIRKKAEQLLSRR